MSHQPGPNRFIRWINRKYCHYWHRLSHLQHSLPGGPLILVGNHISGLDPLLIQAAVDRPLNVMMSRAYYQGMPYARWFFDAVGAIPVNPGGANRNALAESIEVVRQGNVLCLFPEGEANPVIPLHRILPGAVAIALETGAPIIPFRVSGVWPFDHVHLWHAFVRRGRAKIVIGEPIQLPEGVLGKDSLREGVEEMGRAMRRLRKG